MAKDLMFKLRLDSADRERLDRVASHYAVTAATAVRMLIKEKYDLVDQPAGELRNEHYLVLQELSSTPMVIEEITRAMNRRPDEAKIWIGRVLNQLRKKGLIERKSAGYVLTGEGRALMKK